LDVITAAAGIHLLVNGDAATIQWNSQPSWRASHNMSVYAVVSGRRLGLRKTVAIPLERYAKLGINWLKFQKMKRILIEIK
jgi:hypothetical protein